MKIKQSENFSPVEYSVFDGPEYKLVALDSSDDFYGKHDIGGCVLYYLVKDGVPCCDNLFYCMDEQMGGAEKKTIENRFVGNRYVCLYTPVVANSGGCVVKCAKCVFDTSIDKIVYFEGTGHYEEFEVYGNIVVSKFNKCVAYLPSLEIVVEFNDKIEVAAVSKDYVVVCNDKIDSTKMCAVDKRDGIVTDIVLA